MNQLNQHIEALIFCSEQSLGLDEIAASLKLSYGWELTDEEIVTSIEEIREKYQNDSFSFELVEISEGYQFLTKKDFFPTINALIQHKAKKKLSVAQMETLSIIAYKQPIAKSEIEHIRGVNCDYAIQKLLEKELISISGKSDGPGRPILYSTSDSFMDYFGIKSVKDLPQLKDIHVESNEIGTPAEMSEESIPAFDEPVEALSYDAPDGEHGLPAPESISEGSEDEREILSPGISAGSENDEREILRHDVQAEDAGLVAYDEGAEFDLPDRKQIFLENQGNVDAEDSIDEDIRGINPGIGED